MKIAIKQKNYVKLEDDNEFLSRKKKYVKEEN